MIPFLRFKWVYTAISAFLIVIGILSIAFWGYKYSIEFVGGTNLQYQFARQVSANEVKSVFENQKIQLETVSVNKNEISARTRPITDQQEASLRKTLAQKLGTKVNLLKVETIGPSLSAELVNKTFVAVAIAAVGILFYIAYSFKNFTFAIAAVVALLHDLIILMGMYSILSHFTGAEMDTLFVTAALTTMSFSVHDTIIMFDQLRYYMKKNGTADIEMFANKSITETIVRSFNNSLTSFFMLLALVLLGGSTTRYFAAALLIGTVIGTYSSPFVAMNLVVALLKRKKS
jgi:preprotein translocase subunit SecF